LHGVGFDNRALERLGGGSLPFDRVELVTGVAERGNQVSSETRVLLEKKLPEPYDMDLRLEFNPFRNAENYIELEKQLGDSTFLTLYRTSLEQEHSVKIGGAYGFNQEFLNKTQKVISLSKLTFAHKIAKTVLYEQIYRGHCIKNNHPYHK